MTYDANDDSGVLDLPVRPGRSLEDQLWNEGQLRLYLARRLKAAHARIRELEQDAA